MFIGYDAKSKGYKLYNPKSKKTVVSRDVKFDEDDSWNWETREENYNFLPFGDDNSNEIRVDNQPPTSPRSPVLVHDDSSPQSSPEIPQKMRSLQDIYAETNEITDSALYCLFADSEPINFEEATHDKKWRLAMNEEMKAIQKNGTWELTTLPKEKQAVGVKWIYKIKKNKRGEVEKYKARLVAKGFSQQHGIDYDEVFAPVARLETIRLIIALAAQKRWRIFQMDVKSAFLNGHLEEDVYVEQPEGYIVKGQENKVLKLKKALYGLKQAPRAWYNKIDDYFRRREFIKCPHEYGLYVKKKENGDMLIVCLYVDDLIFTGNNLEMISEFKREMATEFEMTDIELMSYYLGIEVKQSNDGIFISQNNYAKKILKEFNMENCQPVSTPVECGTKLSRFDDGERVNPTLFRKLVENRRYLTCSRPDILYGVGLISRYMEAPTCLHMKAAKRILRYVKGTLDYGLFYSSSKNFNLVGYSDSDWGGDIDDRKSTSGFLFCIGETAFTWSSKKQSIVTLSTCEAEYVAAATCVCHAIWIRKLLKTMHLPQEDAIEIFVDNKSAIALGKNPIFHDRSKHIDTRYHFIRESISKKEVQLKYVKSQDQVADIFTKALKFEDFSRLRARLGVTKI